ncbi:MAG: DUF1559 domain-containing protein [Phycisphaerales bacterium]|nr:DUF1559 domain-containing protein [Phycisphaerales bacterium]
MTPASAQPNPLTERRTTRRVAVVRAASSGRIAAGRAFSMVELLVVLAVVVLLMSLLMPAISSVKENARRIVCSSNLRQIGFATAQYAGDNDGHLPAAVVLEDASLGGPQELMSSHRGVKAGQWDGLGLLFKRGYCEQPACFYCPSHHGNHPYERYANDWWDRADLANSNQPVDGPIYMNYHYGGDRSWNPSNIARRRLYDTKKGSQLVIATDGLRSVGDFNHDVGLNVLRSDGAVSWFNSGPKVRSYLPTIDENGLTVSGEEDYAGLWNVIEELANQ